MKASPDKKSVTSPFPEFPGCFVCGQKNPRGLHVPFRSEGEGVVASFVPDETLAGYEEAVHGGIISALLDEALVWASYVATGRFGVTAELNVRFRRPLGVQQRCTVEAKLLENRGKLWVVEGRMVDDGGNVIAEAVGKVVPTANVSRVQSEEGCYGKG